MGDKHYLAEVGVGHCWSSVVWRCTGVDVLAGCEGRHYQGRSHLCRSCLPFAPGTGRWICGRCSGSAIESSYLFAVCNFSHS